MAHSHTTSPLLFIVVILHTIALLQLSRRCVDASALAGGPYGGHLSVGPVLSYNDHVVRGDPGDVERMRLLRTRRAAVPFSGGIYGKRATSLLPYSGGIYGKRAALPVATFHSNTLFGEAARGGPSRPTHRLIGNMGLAEPLWVVRSNRAMPPFNGGMYG